MSCFHLLRITLTLASSLFLPPLSSATGTPPPTMSTTHDEASKKVAVLIDGAVLTEIRYNTFAKPVLWPIHGPGGIPLTRDWPMKTDTPGDDHDHPHHKSLWFTHGDVNGIDFWKEAPDAGKIITSGYPRTTLDDAGRAVVELANEWQAPDGRIICSDTTVIRCSTVPTGTDGPFAHFIHYEITVKATHGEVVFGDTKEGTMAIRTRPEWNVERKNPLAAGTSRNSEGLTGSALWGAKAAWVDYQAPVNKEIMGIAFFDHPSNLRHPTTWHARDYGLVAANPFGLHDFSKKNPQGAGKFTLPAGSEQTWKYGFLLYKGTLTPTQIKAAWTTWAALPSTAK